MASIKMTKCIFTILQFDGMVICLYCKCITYMMHDKCNMKINKSIADAALQ